MAAKLTIAIVGASPVACLCAAYLKAKLNPAQFLVKRLLPPQERVSAITRLGAESLAWLEAMGISAQHLVMQGIADIDLATKLTLADVTHWWAASDYGMALDHLSFLQWFIGARMAGSKAETWQFNSNIILAKNNLFDSRALDVSVNPGLCINNERFMASIGKTVPGIALQSLPEIDSTGYVWRDAKGAEHGAQLLIDCTGQIALQTLSNQDPSQQGLLVALEEKTPIQVSSDQPRQCFSQWSVSPKSIRSRAAGLSWDRQVISQDIFQVRDHWLDRLIAIGAASNNALDLLVSHADVAAFQCQLLANLLTNNAHWKSARSLFNKRCQLHRDEMNMLHNLVCFGFGWTSRLSHDAIRLRDLFLTGGHVSQMEFGLLPESSVGALLWVIGMRPTAVSLFVKATMGSDTGSRMDHLAEWFAAQLAKPEAYPVWLRRQTMSTAI